MQCQKTFSPQEKQNQLRLVGSQDGRQGSVTIHQDFDLYSTLLEPGEQVTHNFKSDRYGWLQMAKGTVELNGQQLYTGDGAAIFQEDQINIQTVSDNAEFLLFDMAAA
ncbi:MAG: hypothetical protein HRU34_21085 [Richelia sp.]|nr:hypothetical protein [Richelia sp.]CDN16248.1 Pirin-like [Richelia intracellularis]